MTSTDLLRFIRRFRRLPHDQQAAVDRLVRSLGDAGHERHPPGAFVALAEPALRAVWDNDEDADYDRL